MSSSTDHPDRTIAAPAGVDASVDAQLRRLIAEHAWILDRGNVLDLPRLYTEDGILVGLDKPLVGRTAIAKWSRERAALTTRRSRHVHANIRFDQLNDELVLGTLVTTLYRHEGDGLGSSTPLSVSDYDDAYALVDGQWLLQRREMTRAFVDHTRDTATPTGPAPTSIAPTVSSIVASPQVYSMEALPREQVREHLSRVAVRSDESIVTFNWFEPEFRSRGTHSHSFDQLSFVFSGELEFTVDGGTYLVPSGSVLRIPAGLPHSAQPRGDDEVLNVDVFAPVREDYVYLTDYQNAEADAANRVRL